MGLSSKDKKILYYSADPHLTPTMMKAGDFDTSCCFQKIESSIQKHGITTFVSDEQGYHFSFLRIPQKPYIIYALGDIGLLDKKKIGIVGPRKSSPYAQRVMKDFFTEIPGYDLVSVSGGAPGVDTQCHTLSVEYNIPTIVVLGGGLLWYLSSGKRSFLERIVANGGLLLSEFRLYQDPTPRTFPHRNRIIAGLSDILFVPAAGEKSGSLITVDFALRIHTPVYTVPASVYEHTSKGSNAYLAAKKMQAMDDMSGLLSQYFSKKNQTSDEHISDATKEHPSLTKTQQNILASVETEPKSIAIIAQEIDCTMHDLLPEITILEMYGLLILHIPGVYRHA